MILDGLSASFDGSFVFWCQQVLDNRESIADVASKHQLTRSHVEGTFWRVDVDEEGAHPFLSVHLFSFWLVQAVDKLLRLLHGVFGKTIGLRVVGTRQNVLDVEPLAPLIEFDGVKLWSSVREDLFWNTED